MDNDPYLGIEKQVYSVTTQALEAIASCVPEKNGDEAMQVAGRMILTYLHELGFTINQ